MKLFVTTVSVALLFAGIAQAQNYDPDYRDRPRYDRGPDDDRPPPPPRYGDDHRSPYGYDHDRDYGRPPPRMVCRIDPPPPFPHRRCGTRPGRPGSPCHCPGLPFPGHRDFE